MTQATQNTATWWNSDIDQYVQALQEYELEDRNDTAYLSTRLAALGPVLSQSDEGLSPAAYEAVEDFSRDYITYAAPVRRVATELIVNLGLDNEDRAKASLDSLKLSLLDKDVSLRELAINGIGQIGFAYPDLGKKAMDLLKTGVNDLNPDVAQRSITWVGTIAKTQQPTQRQALETLDLVIRNSVETEQVLESIHWATEIGLTAEHYVNPAIATLAAIVDPRHDYAPVFARAAIDGLEKIALRDERHAGQVLPVVEYAYSVDGSSMLHEKSADVLFTIAQAYPSLRAKVLETVEKAMSDNYGSTREIGTGTAATLISHMNWDELPADRLRAVFRAHASGDGLANESATALLDMIKDKQRGHIDSLLPQATATRRQP